MATAQVARERERESDRERERERQGDMALLRYSRPSSSALIQVLISDVVRPY